jgi:NH3-dependent NAD+ synthetase
MVENVFSEESIERNLRYIDFAVEFGNRVGLSIEESVDVAFKIMVDAEIDPEADEDEFLSVEKVLDQMAEDQINPGFLCRAAKLTSDFMRIDIKDLSPKTKQDVLKELKETYYKPVRQVNSEQRIRKNNG